MNLHGDEQAIIKNGRGELPTGKTGGPRGRKRSSRRRRHRHHIRRRMHQMDRHIRFHALNCRDALPRRGTLR